MPEIKIKIGAAVDQSMRTVFKPLVQAAAEARKQIAKEFSGLAVGLKGGFTAGGAAAKKEFTGIAKAGEDLARQLERQRAQSTRIAEQNSKREWGTYLAEAKKASAGVAQENKSVWQAFAREAKLASRAAEDSAKASQASISRFAERTSHRATRFFMPNMPIMSLARRAGAEVLQGVGVETSIAGLVQRGVGIESAATALSNRGHVEGAAGANGQVVASSVLQSEARDVGAKTAVNPEELLAAGREFVGLTGDLDLWRKIMPQVARQTAALGGNQEQAAKAAGEFAAHVGDVPDKEKAILDLMAVAAGQGKIGGVDFSDFAKYAAKAAAPAALFQGDKAQNIGKLTALAEIAKMHGGASSAAEAFTAISSFTTTLKKPARFKSISSLIDDKNGQFADSEHTQIKDPLELIKAMIVGASKGSKDGKSSLDKLAAAVGDARSLKAVSGLQNTFNEAGGGQAGLDAMNVELKKFAGAVMTSSETERALSEELKTSKSRAERFNQAMEGIVHGTMEKLGPALENLQEPALKAAGSLGAIATWAASNPGAAIMTAIAAAITRAGIESAFRSGIENAINGVGAAAGKKGFLGGMGIAGNLNAALAITSLAVGTFEAGKLIINDLFEGNADQQRKGALANANDAVALDNANVHIAKTGGITNEDRTALEKALASLQNRVGDASKYDKLYGKGPGGDALAMFDSLSGVGLKNPTGSKSDLQHIAELKTELKQVSSLLADLKTGTLNVRVTNQEQPRAARVGTTAVDHF